MSAAHDLRGIAPWSTPKLVEMRRLKDNHYFADKLALAGIAIFPCSKQKKPFIEAWRENSTTEIGQIEEWWGKWPDALPAIDVGKSGLLILDGDRHPNKDGVVEHDGVVALDGLLLEHGVQPNEIPTVFTPGNGEHKIFRQPEGRPLGNSEGKIRGRGINVRGDGGYVVAPGAQFGDKAYTWDRTTPNFYTAWRARQIPELPARIVDLLRNRHEEMAKGDTAKATGPDNRTNNARGRVYAAAALEGCAEELASKPHAPSGRNELCNALAFRMGTMVARGWIDRYQVFKQLLDAARVCGLVKDDGEMAVRKTLKSGLDAGVKEPYRDLEDTEDDDRSKDKSQELPKKDGRAPARETLISVRASTVKMHGIRWFWPDRIALGKLGLIGGLPDKGKGLVSADLIARATTGGTWPCNEGVAPKGNVIWFTAEDDIEDTIIPRLVAAGADLDRVEIVKMVRNSDGAERMFNLATDLPVLKEKIEEVADVMLVVIDPVSAYLGVGKINNASTTDVRGVLSPLTKLAEEKQIAIIGIMHFNKKADVTNAMLRIADSLAYVAAARHVYVVVDDPENEKARLFVKAKNNLAPDKHALRFMVGTCKVGLDQELETEIWAPHVLWDTEHVEVTAAQAMVAEASAGGSRTARREAEDFLASKLVLGEADVDSINEEAQVNGISQATLRRAKRDLGIKAVKKGMSGGWVWKLP
jgi:putative DNA primase/helicase